MSVYTFLHGLLGNIQLWGRHKATWWLWRQILNCPMGCTVVLFISRTPESEGHETASPLLARHFGQGHSWWSKVWLCEANITSFIVYAFCSQLLSFPFSFYKDQNLICSLYVLFHFCEESGTAVEKWKLLLLWGVEDEMILSEWSYCVTFKQIIGVCLSAFLFTLAFLTGVIL